MKLASALALMCVTGINGLNCDETSHASLETNRAIPLADTDRGTRIDNMLHCIMEFQFYGSYAVNGWQSTCLNFLAEYPLEK